MASAAPRWYSAAALLLLLLVPWIGPAVVRAQGGNNQTCPAALSYCIDKVDQSSSCFKDASNATAQDICCQVLVPFTRCFDANAEPVCAGPNNPRDAFTEFKQGCDSYLSTFGLGPLFPNVEPLRARVSPDCFAAVETCATDNDITGPCGETFSPDCCNVANSRAMCLDALPSNVCGISWTRGYSSRRSAINRFLRRACRSPSPSPTETPTGTTSPPRTPSPTPTVDPELRDCTTAVDNCRTESDFLLRCRDLGDDCCDSARAVESCVDAAIARGCPAFRSNFDELVTQARSFVENSCDESSDPCFPADALVELEDGSLRAMVAVEIGDRIRADSTHFSDVYFFSHRISGPRKFPFVRVHAEDGSSVALSPTHYLYANDGLVAARSVSEGDFVETRNGTRVRVTSTELVVLPGLYNPHTLTGTVVVDGIKASAYTTAVRPVLANVLLLPFRAMYRAGAAPPRLLDADVPKAMWRLLRLLSDSAGSV